MSLRDLCDTAYVLQVEPLRFDFDLRREFDEALNAEAEQATPTTERGREMSDMLHRLGAA